MTIEYRNMLKEDEKHIIPLFVDAFQSKFEHMSSLSINSLYEFFYDASYFSTLPLESVWVATQNQKIIGVMNLKWAFQKKRKKEKRLNIFQLFKKYGMKETFKVSFGMSLLEHSVLRHDCYVAFIAVAEEARGQKVGTGLFDLADEYATSNDLVDRMTLYVAADNQAAELYHRLGYRIESKMNSLITKKIYGYKQWYFMVKPLSKSFEQKKLYFKRHWYLGFLGLISILSLPQIIDAFQGGSKLPLLNLIWLYWLTYFKPYYRKK